ncbi:MAG: FCD domain-containing protein [Oscillospiraceae bacterium]
MRVTAWRADRYQISNREHIDILDAILEKDVDRACRLMEEHIQLSYQEAIHTMMHASF